MATLFGLELSPTVWAALIAANTSAFVAITSQIFGYIANRRVERLKSALVSEVESGKAHLSDLNSARSARRDYEYEARKKLYTEIEPLLFQLYEAAELAYYRVRSLARTARNENLGWLAGRGYYLNSTMYYLILPAVYYRLIRKRMTFIDLDLDDQISMKYYLTKIYALAFTEDFAVADLGIPLQYTPNAPDWQQEVQRRPAQFYRQGLVLGDLEAILDEMIVGDGMDARVVTFTEFEAKLPTLLPDAALAELRKLLEGFTPERRPVFARILLVLAGLSRLILEAYEAANAYELPAAADYFANSDEFLESFAWRDRVANDDQALVQKYLVDHVQSLQHRKRRAHVLS